MPVKQLFICGSKARRPHTLRAGPGWHLHNVANCVPPHLRVDEVRGSDRPVQIWAPINDYQKIVSCMVRMLEQDCELHCLKGRQYVLCRHMIIAFQCATSTCRKSPDIPPFASP